MHFPKIRLNGRALVLVCFLGPQGSCPTNDVVLSLFFVLTVSLSRSLYVWYLILLVLVVCLSLCLAISRTLYVLFLLLLVVCLSSSLSLSVSLSLSLSVCWLRLTVTYCLHVHNVSGAVPGRSSKACSSEGVLFLGWLEVSTNEMK